MVEKWQLTTIPWTEEADGPVSYEVSHRVRLTEGITLHFAFRIFLQIRVAWGAAVRMREGWLGMILTGPPDLCIGILEMGSNSVESGCTG